MLSSFFEVLKFWLLIIDFFLLLTEKIWDRLKHECIHQNSIIVYLSYMRTYLSTT